MPHFGLHLTNQLSLVHLIKTALCVSLQNLASGGFERTRFIEWLEVVYDATLILTQLWRL
jgi:hypothetical protein